MTNIVLVTPILQHYRLTFYEKLSNADPDFRLSVYYGYSKKESGRPSFVGNTPFLSKPFKEYKFRLFPFDLVYNRGLYSAVVQLNPDVVIVQGIAGDLSNRLILRWARCNGKRVIIWACGWDPGRAHGMFLRFKNWLVHRYLRKADYFLTYSTKASNYVKGFGFNDSIIETCYNGIEIDGMIEDKVRILEAAREVRHSIHLDNFVSFIYVGGLLKEKRIDMLIKAFAALREKFDNIKLLIIGDGPFRSEMEELLREVGDKKIIYLGRIVKDVDAYFAAADCLVLPGIGGLALNQAMFWRKTCIVSKADGTEDDLVIDGQTGYRFESGSLISLTAAMERRILEDPAKMTKMSENAYQIIVNKSNVNSMVSCFTSAIKKLTIVN